MSIKSFLAKPFASFIYKQTKKNSENALADQHALLNVLIKTAKNTLFGKDHCFGKIENYEDFKKIGNK